MKSDFKKWMVMAVVAAAVGGGFVAAVVKQGLEERALARQREAEFRAEQEAVIRDFRNHITVLRQVVSGGRINAGLLWDYYRKAETCFKQNEAGLCYYQRDFRGVGELVYRCNQRDSTDNEWLELLAECDAILKGNPLSVSH